MRTDIITYRDADGLPTIPEQYSYIMAQRYIAHETPTAHPGFYHRHLIHAGGHWDMRLAIQKFKRELREIPNALILNDFKMTHAPGAGPFAHTLEIFYSVEGPAPADTKNNRMLGAMLYPYC